MCDAPFRNEVSFTAKRLIMVEYVEKNGTNKEIRRPGQAGAPCEDSVNDLRATRFVYEAVTVMASPSCASFTVTPQACASSRV